MEKVFLIVPTLVGHGEERMAALAAEVLQQKYEVSLIVFTKEEQQYFPNCKIVDLNIPAVDGMTGKIANMFQRARRVKKMRANEKPAAVISFGTSANFTNVFSKGTGKTIISYRGFASVQKGLSFFISCFLATRIFCISKDLANQLVSLAPWAKNKTSVIYNRVDIDAIDKMKNEGCTYAPSKPAFVSVGRLEHVKGQDHLLKSFKLVADAIPSASLTMIGEGSAGEELRQLAEKLGIAQKVNFIGAKKNPFKYMAKCDVCVQSSISEGFLNVLVESFACGIPAISTDCRSGPSEIIADTDVHNDKEIQLAQYGILVPPFKEYGSCEPEKEVLLSEAMIQLVTDEKLYQTYQRAVRQRAQFFSKDAYFNDLDRIIGGVNCGAK